MGNPQALGFLGEKLTAGKDYPDAEMWVIFLWQSR
jgi:hypothetical protein